MQQIKIMKYKLIILIRREYATSNHMKVEIINYIMSIILEWWVFKKFNKLIMDRLLKVDSNFKKLFLKFLLIRLLNYFMLNSMMYQIASLILDKSWLLFLFINLEIFTYRFIIIDSIEFNHLWKQKTYKQSIWISNSEASLCYLFS